MEPEGSRGNNLSTDRFLIWSIIFIPVIVEYFSGYLFDTSNYNIDYGCDQAFRFKLWLVSGYKPQYPLYITLEISDIRHSIRISCFPVSMLRLS